jgi:hypothetical protein
VQNLETHAPHVNLEPFHYPVILHVHLVDRDSIRHLQAQENALRVLETLTMKYLVLHVFLSAMPVLLEPLLPSQEQAQVLIV